MLACAKFSTPIMLKISVSPLASMNSSMPYTKPFSSEMTKTSCAPSPRCAPGQDAGRFILQVVGNVSSEAGIIDSVFQPRPVCSESYFTPLVNTTA